MDRLLTGLAVVVGLLAFSLPPAKSEPVRVVSAEEARVFVNALHGDLLALEQKRSNTLGFDATFRTFIHRVFDVDGLARLAVGSAWAQAEPEQREEYRQLYAAWTVKTFRGYFTGAPSGITVFSSEAIPDSRDAYVRIVARAAIVPVLVGARIRRVGEDLKIIDLACAGISLIKTQRDDFAAVLTKRGMPGLLAELRSKVAPATMVGANP
jgi:ABC-type transporter MlaC component